MLVRIFLQAGFRCCYSTNTVKALKEQMDDTPKKSNTEYNCKQH